MRLARQARASYTAAENERDAFARYRHALRASVMLDVLRALFVQSELNSACACDVRRLQDATNAVRDEARSALGQRTCDVNSPRRNGQSCVFHGIIVFPSKQVSTSYNASLLQSASHVVTYADF